MDRRLRDLSLTVSPSQRETPKDGNCLFHSLLDQLRYNSELHDFAEDHEEFRTKVVDVIMNNSLGDCTIMTVSSWKNTESSQSSMSSSSKGIVMIQSDYSYLQDDKTINSLKVSWS